MQKLRIGVLMGGMSNEREVSFNSGRTICDHLDTACYHVVPVFQTRTNQLYILPWSFLHRGTISDFENRLAGQAQEVLWDQLKQYVDLVYIAMHGRYAEDGTMQGVLEMLGIPYVGSKVLASAIGMDKIFQKHLLSSNGIVVANGYQLQPHEHIDSASIMHHLAEKNIAFPIIVKPNQEGSSFGISVVHNAEQLYQAVYQARFVGTRAQAVLLEEFIKGMEFSCIVMHDGTDGLKVLSTTEIVKPRAYDFFNYEQKYMPGKSLQFTPARCANHQQQLIHSTCIRVARILEMKTIGRIDGFLQDDDTVVITDPNTFSGAAPSSFLFKQAAQHNLNHTQLINHLIASECKYYNIHFSATQTKHGDSMARKKRVVVLLAGASNEKEISLESGRNIVYKLSPHTYEVIPVFVSRDLKLYTINAQLLLSTTTSIIEAHLDQSWSINWHDLPRIADFVFIGLHGGHGENGCVQAMLEMLKLPYNGSSVLTSALCMDKFKANQFLKSHGFDVPQALLVERNDWQQEQPTIIDTIEKTIQLPCIVKPHDDGCSILVNKAYSIDVLCQAINEVFNANKQYVLIEQLIHGIELTGGVIGNNRPYALPPSQAVARQGILSIEEKFLPGAGENQTPALLKQTALRHVQKTLERAYAVLGCKGYARIDCFYQPAEMSFDGNDRVVILEVNTLPGLTPATCLFHQAAEIGLKPMEFIDLIVTLGLQEHAQYLPEQTLTSNTRHGAYCSL